MDDFQVTPIPDSLKNLMAPLAHDFRGALSYVSFYPINSTFVTQAVQKLHKDLQRILQEVDPLIIHMNENKLFVNDTALSLDDLMKLFQDKDIRGVEITRDFSLKELTAWLQVMAFPVEDQNAELEMITHLRSIAQELAPADGSETGPGKNIGHFTRVDSTISEPSTLSHEIGLISEQPADLSRQALLSFVAETWQYSQIQKKPWRIPPKDGS